MSTLTELKARILAYLIDATGASFTNSTVEEAVRQALDEYTRNLPLTKDTVITLPGAGKEVALNGLTGIIDLLSMYYPYNTLLTLDAQADNQVLGWFMWFDDAQPMATVRCRVPLEASHDMRIKYTTSHTISGLDSASITTLYPLHESMFVRGCAGYAAISRTVDKIEQRQYGTGSKEPDQLRQWAFEQINIYKRDLTNLKRYGTPNDLTPRWSVDQWDTNL
jgi:hypothetical protein